MTNTRVHFETIANMIYPRNKTGAENIRAEMKSETDLQTNGNRHPGQMTRRAFIRTFGVTAAAYALNACGGGGGGSARGNDSHSTPPPSDVDATATWSTVPTIAFTEGVAATISIGSYVSDADHYSITKNAAALPLGVTYDPASKSFIYDGLGAANSTDGHVLTAVKG